MPLQCWKCGEPLKDIILPFSRQEECSSCLADQHVCKLCSEYNPNISNQCREDRADYVADKDRANFCDFFKARENAYQKKDAQGQLEARTKLAELFGEVPLEADHVTQGEDALEKPQTEAEKALQELKRLFGD